MPLAIWPEVTLAQGGTYFIQGKPVSYQVYQGATLVNEGLALLRANRNQEAADKLSQAVKLAPDLAEAHNNLGLALAKLGRLPEAVEQLKQAVALSPDLAATWLSMGGLYQSSGKLDEAIKAYREFLNRFPNHSEAPKIANLVKGLEAESRRQQAAGQSTNGQQLSLSAAAAGDDYLAEVTSQGVLRWPARRIPLRVYVRPGQSVPGFRPAFLSILNQAFEDWARASDGRVSFVFVSDPNKAEIECSWTNDPGQLANSAESAETRVFTDREGIAKGTIKLLTVPLSAELPLTDNRARLICLHEIGHVLGLAGHTKNPADIMFYSSSFVDEWRVLTQRDSNTVIRLYSSE